MQTVEEWAAPGECDNMIEKKTQTEKVLDYMLEFGSITAFEAMKDLACMRLASRISDLKKQGYPIESKVEAVKNRYGENCYVKRYSLGGEFQCER